MVHAQSPFSAKACSVPCALEHRWQGIDAFWQGHLPAFQTIGEAPQFIITSDIGVAGVFTCHQHAPGGSADRSPGIVLCEPNSFPRQLVEVWGSDFFLAITSQFAIPQVIGIDIDNVGSSWAAGLANGECGEDN